MATKLPYLNVLEVESVNKEDVSRAIVIDKDEYVKALDIEQITTYQGLSNKPKINGVELDGDISLDELNVASKEDLNKVISDLEDITSDIPTSENIQDKIDDSLKNYPTKSDVTTEINNSIADKADKSEIPTKVSQLENDEGFISSIPSEYVTEDELNDIISGLDIQNIPFLIVSAEPYEYSNYNYVGNFTDTFNAIQNNKPYLIYVPGGWMNYKILANGVQIDNNTIRCVGFLHTGTEHYMSGWIISNTNAQLISNGFVVKNYATSEELNDKQDTLVSGENIKTINNESILGSGNININVDLTGYATEQWVEDKGYLTSESLTTINSDIDELETSKQEAFQVNQPLVFSRSGEDLVLDVNLDNYVTDTELDSKQDKLISGTNIKTINGNSVLGEGNIEISGGDTTTVLIIDESTSKLIKGTYEDGYNALTNNEPILIYTSYVPALGPSSLIPADTIRLVNGTIIAYFHTEYDTPTSTFSPHTHTIKVWNISSSSLTSESYTHSFVTDTELNTKQDKLTPGDNINITNNVISWEAPDIQFVNNIFTDDESLKYAVSDFKGTYTEKEFPVATQESAGLMSVADKTKLDNLDENGGSIPYLKVGLTSIVSGDFDAVYNAIINNEPYFLQVVGSGGEYWGTYINPEGVRASNNTIQCHSEEHNLSGTYDHFNWTITADSVTVVSQYGNAIPYLKVGLTSIIAGDFNAVYNAITKNQPYFLQVTWSGGEIYGYYAIPETIWARNNAIYCTNLEHKSNGTYNFHSWVITAETVTLTSDINNAIPFLQINNNEIVSGTFAEVYEAIKYNHPYFIKLYITGTTGYWGDPEMTRIDGDNLECWSTYHPVDGSYTQVMWTITPDGTVTKREWELDLATQTELNAKQDTLVSGTNIKTINGNSILGEGNLVISGSGSGTSNYNDLSNKPSIEGVSLEGALDAHQLNLTEYEEFIPLKAKVDDNIPYYLKCGTSTIISGNFDDVYNAIKNNKNYRIELMLVNVGSTVASYFGQPEVVRIEGDNIVCYASIHFNGEYQRSTWTISSTGVSVTSSSFNLIETETSSSSVPQVEKIITLTQDEYDALSEYDSTVLYLIV